MWLIWGLIAILFAILNVYRTMKDKDAKWFRYLSLSATILTLCAEYSTLNQWVIDKDWSAVLDVAPYMTDILWFLSITSIAINSVSLFYKRNIEN